jgi:hypothetical protein
MKDTSLCEIKWLSLELQNYVDLGFVLMPYMLSQATDQAAAYSLFKPRLGAVFTGAFSFGSSCSRGLCSVNPGFLIGICGGLINWDAEWVSLRGVMVA